MTTADLHDILDDLEYELVELREMIEVHRTDGDLLRARKQLQEHQQWASQALFTMRIEDQFSVADCQRMAQLRHYLTCLLTAIDRQFNKIRYD